MVHRKELVGTVVSDKMQKTVVVEVLRMTKHPFYKKYYRKKKKYKTHDEKNQASIGDRVSIIEARPFSKEKRWALKEVLRKSLIGHQEQVPSSE